MDSEVPYQSKSKWVKLKNALMNKTPKSEKKIMTYTLEQGIQVKIEENFEPVTREKLLNACNTNDV